MRQPWTFAAGKNDESVKLGKCSEGGCYLAPGFQLFSRGERSYVQVDS